MDSKKNKKIKILATGDFHSDVSLPNKIKENVNLDEIDLIIFTGDLSDRKDDFKILLEDFQEKEIFMIPGNHESKKKLDTLQKHYNVKLIGNNPIVIDDKLAIFGTNYLNVGEYSVLEEEVLTNLIENFKEIEDIKLKIHVSHIPPIGTKIGDMSPYHFVSGSLAQRIFLEQFSPQISLCGHIHESAGLEEIVNKTKLVNVGRTFKIFEIDLEKEEIEIKN